MDSTECGDLDGNSAGEAIEEGLDFDAKMWGDVATLFTKGDRTECVANGLGPTLLIGLILGEETGLAVGGCGEFSESTSKSSRLAS